MSALVFGKEVGLQTFGKDKYGRTIADVLLPDGTNVNHMLVKDGWCWWYRKYAPGNVILEELGTKGTRIRLELWAEAYSYPALGLSKNHTYRASLDLPSGCRHQAAEPDIPRCDLITKYKSPRIPLGTFDGNIIETLNVSR